jgi:hypothetical protein
MAREIREDLARWAVDPDEKAAPPLIPAQAGGKEELAGELRPGARSSSRSG